MQIRRVRTEDPDLDRFVSECWRPYHEDLSETVAEHALADDLDRDAVVERHRDRLESPSKRLWVAVEGGDAAASLATTDATFAGFVRTRLAPSPRRFDWPVRLAIRDVWVRESFRGTGLAEDLLGRAVRQAREDGCDELTVDVATDNDRAIAFFEALGFETRGFRMRVPVDAVSDDLADTDPVSGDDASLQLRRVRVDEAVMRRFVAECWEPFWRDLGEAVGKRHLSPDLDRDRLVADLLDSYDVPDRRCWTVLDECEDPAADLDEVDAVFAGWLNAGLEPTDRFLDPPDRLFLGNLYLKPAYRGSGLADRLVARAVEYAREEGCVELCLDVELANDRARAYYEKLGFEPHRRRMAVPLESIAL